MLRTLDKATGEINPFERPIRKKGPKILKILSGNTMYRVKDVISPVELEIILRTSNFFSLRKFSNNGLTELPKINPEVMIIISRELSKALRS